MKTDNELIAEFMGAVVAKEVWGGSGSFHRIWNIKHPVNNSDCVYDGVGMKYATSWDWLMPVVEKIESTELQNSFFPCIKIVGNAVAFDTGGDYIYHKNSASKIENVYKAVVDFIKFYNSQNV